MYRLRYPANVTHSKYGIIRYPAGLEILKKRIIVINISIQRMLSQTKENKYASKLKKRIGQKKLNTSCIPYTVKAARFGFADVRTRYEAIPIRVYNIVHAIGNSHPGGESVGLLRV